MKKVISVIVLILMLSFTFAGCGMESSDQDSRKYVDVPVLMYHSIGYTENNSYVVTPEKFKHQMELLKENGYTTVTFDELVNYVETGAKLPEKPIAVTFDDGYLDNYQYAYPILKELGMKATINTVGIFIGADTYKDTGNEIMPHFNAEQGKEMLDSGVIDLQLHSYDLHRDPMDEDYRFGTEQPEGESDEEYRQILTEDTDKCKDIFVEAFGMDDEDLFVYAYPQGAYNEISEEVMSQLNIKVTLTVKPGMNRVEKGVGDSLREMYRFDVYSTMDDEEFLYNASREYEG